MSREAVPMGGPKALSQRELLRLIEEATGRKIHIEPMTEEQIKAARAGASDPLTSSFLGLFAALARGDEIPPSWAGKLNVRSTPAEEWVTKAFA